MESKKAQASAVAANINQDDESLQERLNIQYRNENVGIIGAAAVQDEAGTGLVIRFETVKGMVDLQLTVPFAKGLVEKIQVAVSRLADGSGSR